MIEQVKCVVCGSQSTKTANYETFRVFYECPVCGRFELGLSDLSRSVDSNRLAPYLAHNRFDSQHVSEYRYHKGILSQSDFHQRMLHLAGAMRPRCG